MDPPATTREKPHPTKPDQLPDFKDQARSAAIAATAPSVQERSIYAVAVDEDPATLPEAVLQAYTSGINDPPASTPQTNLPAPTSEIYNSRSNSGGGLTNDDCTVTPSENRTEGVTPKERLPTWFALFIFSGYSLAAILIQSDYVIASLLSCFLGLALAFFGVALSLVSRNWFTGKVPEVALVIVFFAIWGYAMTAA